MKTILIVDDIPANNILMEHFVRKNWAKIEWNGEIPEYSIETFSDSCEAAKTIEDKAYDLIISDYMMPVLTGENLIHRARWSAYNSKTPIIISSAFYDNPVVESLKVIYENVEVITKPIEMDKILKTFNKMLIGEK